jgi:cytochrome c553
MKKVKTVLLWLFVVGCFVYLALHSFIWYKKLDVQATAMANPEPHPGNFLFNSSCIGCHGFNGKGKPSTPHVPRLHGQHKEYIIAQLKAIQAGERTGHLVSHMKIALPSLTDEQLKLVAEHLEMIGEYDSSRDLQ